MKIQLPIKHIYFNIKSNTANSYVTIEDIDINEEWKELEFKGKPSGYMVSNLGNVRKPDGSPAPLYYDKNGYTRFCLYIPKNDPVYMNPIRIAYPYKTHRAVAELFIPNPNPEEYTLVMHLNDIPDCNVYLNLQWGSGKMNMDDKKRSGRSKYLRGDDKPDKLFTEKEVRQLCDVMYNQGVSDKNRIIEILGYTDKSNEWKTSFKNLIHNVRRGHCWKYVQQEYI